MTHDCPRTPLCPPPTAVCGLQVAGASGDALLALRLSGQLLLGLVRVFARKVVYLQEVSTGGQVGFRPACWG